MKFTSLFYGIILAGKALYVYIIIGCEENK